MLGINVFLRIHIEVQGTNNAIHEPHPSMPTHAHQEGLLLEATQVALYK